MLARLISLRSRIASTPVVLLLVVAATLSAQEFKGWSDGVEWPEPVVVTPGPTAGSPPSDAIVLFDGKDLSAWDNVNDWTIENGYGIVGSTITSKEKFGDCQLHLEFATPEVIEGTGQGRGNSGIFFMGKYEVQILDSYENKTYFDGQCGSIYKQRPPLVNACRAPGEWQTMDIVFKAPRFNEDGSLKSPAYLTVFHNGVLVQNHWEVKGETFWHQAPSYTAHEGRGSLTLQHHLNPVRFRNIWVRNLVDDTPPAAVTPEPASQEAS